jgi:hypothetical protein
MEPIVLNMDKEGWALEMHEGAIMNKGTVEHIKDAAAVLGSYFDVLAIRAFPSLTNKAYMSPLNEDGGIGPKMGIFGDQVLVTRQDTLTPDLPAVAAAKSGWPFLVIAAGIITLFVVLK